MGAAGRADPVDTAPYAYKVHADPTDTAHSAPWMTANAAIPVPEMGRMCRYGANGRFGSRDFSLPMVPKPPTNAKKKCKNEYFDTIYSTIMMYSYHIWKLTVR